MERLHVLFRGFHTTILVALLALCALVVAATTGCGKSSHDRPAVRLSDASEEAEKSPDEQKRVVPPRKKGESYAGDDEDEDEDGPGLGDVAVGMLLADDGSEVASSEPGSAGAAEDSTLELGVIVGGGTLGRNKLDGFGALGVGFGARPTPRSTVGFYLMFLTLNQRPDATVGAGITDEYEFSLGGDARVSVTKPHTFVGLSPIVGARYSWMHFKFKNAITVSDGNGTRTVGSDWLGNFSLYGGINLMFGQASAFHPSVDLTYGYKFYRDETREGFYNDIYADEPFAQLLLRFSFTL